VASVTVNVASFDPLTRKCVKGNFLFFWLISCIFCRHASWIKFVAGDFSATAASADR
jgi:hypothetical protein